MDLLPSLLGKIEADANADANVGAGAQYAWPLLRARCIHPPFPSGAVSNAEHNTHDGMTRRHRNT